MRKSILIIFAAVLLLFVYWCWTITVAVSNLHVSHKGLKQEINGLKEVVRHGSDRTEQDKVTSEHP